MIIRSTVYFCNDKSLNYTICLMYNIYNNNKVYESVSPKCYAFKIDITVATINT